jgi:hypothetical protein
MCDEIIQRGLPVLAEESKLDLRERFNCMVRTTGEQVIYIELPRDPEAQRLFLDGIPVYNETNLPREGIFTWILYRTAGSPIKFAATEAISPFEIGTMHKTLAALVKADTIHGAGELKDGSFNVLSGTYMLKWKMEHYEDPVCTPDILESIVINLVKPFLRGYQLTNTTFIAQSQRVSPAVLDQYRAAGFLVKTYPNKAACEADPDTSNYKLAEARREAQRKTQQAMQARVTELGKRNRSV